MDAIQSLPLILMTALVATATPGPATLAISATAMGEGARPALRLALGVLCGSLIWSIAAALGLSALMLAQLWAVEVIRYAGAGYLAWLAWKSARAAWAGLPPGARVPVRSRHFLRGLALHVTNPKAIFFFGALYSVMLSPGQSPAALAVVVAAVGVQSAVVFLGYALLFSRPGPTAAYRRAYRWIQGASAVLFGAFSVRLLTARIGA